MRRSKPWEVEEDSLSGHEAVVSSRENDGSVERLNRRVRRGVICRREARVVEVELDLRERVVVLPVCESGRCEVEGFRAVQFDAGKNEREVSRRRGRSSTSDSSNLPDPGRSSDMIDGRSIPGDAGDFRGSVDGC